MTDANRPDLKEDLERQLRFVRSAFNLSDEEMEELREEYGYMEEFLNDVMEHGDRTEKLLDDADDGSDARFCYG